MADERKVKVVWPGKPGHYQIINVKDYDPKYHRIFPDAEYPDECVRRDIEWIWDRINMLFMNTAEDRKQIMQIFGKLPD